MLKVPPKMTSFLWNYSRENRAHTCKHITSKRSWNKVKISQKKDPKRWRGSRCLKRVPEPNSGSAALHVKTCKPHSSFLWVPAIMKLCPWHIVIEPLSLNYAPVLGIKHKDHWLQSVSASRKMPIWHVTNPDLLAFQRSVLASLTFTELSERF